MNDRFKYIAITIIIFLTFIFAVSANYYRILYLCGSVKEFFAGSEPEPEYSSDRQLTVNLPPVKKVFADLPAGFIHCGPFLLFTADRDMAIDGPLKEIITLTGEYRISSLKKKTMAANGLKNGRLVSGQTIIIPEALPALLPDPGNSSMPELISARGLYLTGTSAANPELISRIPAMKKAGLNAVVFDVKDIAGILSYRSHVPAALKYGLHEQACIDNIDMFIKTLKAKGIYVIARISAFRDMLLVKKNPKLAVRSAKNGGLWSAGKERWCDPTCLEVQEYILSLAQEMALKGVDEVQFDYIRFPTGGDQTDAVFSWQCGKMPREQVIAQFLEKAHRLMIQMNTRLSIDTFGVVAWGKKADINTTGQRIELLAGHCDYISPMLYPSHFNDGFEGFRNPADSPKYFISEGNKKFLTLSAGTSAVIRPWLQAFKWKVSNYSPGYIVEQIKASDSSGGRGYLFWNASNEYGYVMDAMNAMTRAGLVK